MLNNVDIIERCKLLTGITLEEEELLASGARGRAFESRRAYHIPRDSATRERSDPLGNAIRLSSCCYCVSGQAVIGCGF